MKLIDKFRYALWEDTDANGSEVENKCEKIAEDFAIRFAKWIDSRYYQGDNDNEYYITVTEYRDGILYTVNELLKIYKKEKGL